MNRFVATLQKLSTKTEAGGLAWQTTADEDSFRIGLGDGLVRVNRSTDDDGDVQFSASLFDAHSREVENISGWSNIRSQADEYAVLKALFECARRSALSIDKLLDSIDKDIEQGKSRPIQDEPKPKKGAPF